MLEKSEFLINLMYDFANRAVNIGKHDEDIEELVGEKITLKGNEEPHERQDLLLSAYRRNIKSYYGLGKEGDPRSSYIPINRPRTVKVLYFLIYFTSHPKGIEVFKEAAERMLFVQRVTHQELILKKQEMAVGTGDLFGCDESIESTEENNNKFMAKWHLEETLSKTPTLFDIYYWADLLETTDLYPTDFQLAMKELYKENKVRNLDADVSRRRTRFIQPDWPNKSERWVLK